MSSGTSIRQGLLLGLPFQEFILCAHCGTYAGESDGSCCQAEESLSEEQQSPQVNDQYLYQSVIGAIADIGLLPDDEQEMRDAELL